MNKSKWKMCKDQLNIKQLLKEIKEIEKSLKILNEKRGVNES
tara:strand:- start:929 stop:1054 length:126 start_codon:yes stop_codon:yes gene_type:complete